MPLNAEEQLWNEISNSFMNFELKMRSFKHLRNSKWMKVKTRQTNLEEFIKN